MDPLQSNQTAIPSTGNPLDMGASPSTPPTTSLQPPAPTQPQIQAVPIENAPEPGTASATIVDPFRNVVTPPMPISSAVGTGSVTLDQTAGGQPAPQKSSALGIIIGIMLLISIVVGASLYYYFAIYSKPAPVIETPPPVTLIQNETKPEATEQPVITPPAPPSVDPTSLLSDIDKADSNLANVDVTIGVLDEQIK